ncbi:MAG TPA: DNA repair protein RadC [Mesotoga infera]|nr:DNA repair protein RadC [Mesotoga infera]HRR43219.1 DNA repair protein RadC [Mesotoga sp.]HNS67092.1 DNA repair protein RadC [Mesotoga infera]HOI33616.1 DNA repair protein RadC [Mesotoga infera]HON26892.1 DNA repair protein RadC [Mesotoga infera]
MEDTVLMPREKLLELGAERLTNEELVAILLRTGVKGKGVMEFSKELLNRYGSLTALLCADVREVMNVKGMGLAKAVLFKASLELGHRVFREMSKKTRMKLDEPESVYYLCHDMTLLDRETVRVISLDTRLNYCGLNTVSVGILDSSLLHPREVFKPAISRTAAAIILVHNHPSGDPSPSKEDGNITDRIKEAGETLGIKLLDHIIIGKGSFFSFTAGRVFYTEVGDDFQRKSL